MPIERVGNDIAMIGVEGVGDGFELLPGVAIAVIVGVKHRDGIGYFGCPVLDAKIVRFIKRLSVRIIDGKEGIGAQYLVGFQEKQLVVLCEIGKVFGLRIRDEEGQALLLVAVQVGYLIGQVEAPGEPKLPG